MSRNDLREERTESHIEISPERSHDTEQSIRTGAGDSQQAQITAGGQSPQILSRCRESVTVRDLTLRVSPVDLSTLETIGKFRVLALADLAQFQYGGESDLLRGDVGNLTRQDLIREHRGWVTLTEAGAGLVQQQQEPRERQAIYHGLVKPKELKHDAAIYRMYHAEAAEICKAGGHIRRVVLDYEFKKKVYSPLAKARELPRTEFVKKQAEIAAANSLRVINGKMPLPDLRIEYETSSGEMAKVDLELASEHYHAGHTAEKVAAGFKIYASTANASRLNAALTRGGGTISEGPELTASILSL